jgi:hypothetical protein
MMFLSCGCNKTAASLDVTDAKLVGWLREHAPFSPALAAVGALTPWCWHLAVQETIEIPGPFCLFLLFVTD